MTGFSPGTLIDGKYRLVSPLGSGGMGTVWRAEHLVLRSSVAVKLMHRRIASSADAAVRFQREAQAAAALRSPHVVSVLDSGVSGETPYVVMELLEGESLDQRLARRGTLRIDEIARIVSQVARALGRAHEAGIVHRDLKPANIFLQHNADEEIAKVLDFGVVKLSSIAELSPLTSTGAVLGSPHYMSPEQARGRREVDHRSDLWALGIIAFECLVGRRPFESEVLGDLLLKICSDQVPPPSTLAPVPAGFDAWFARAIEREPERRFQSAAEMAEALRALVPAAVPSMPVPVPSAAPAYASLPPSPTQSGGGLALGLGIGALLLGLVIVLGGLGVFLYATSSEREATATSASPAGALPAPVAASSTPLAETPSASASATPAQPPRATTAKAKAATPSKSPAATSTASDSDACVRACNKLRACAPGTKCDSSGPCTGYKRSLADCVNGTPCAKILDTCLP